MAKGFIPTAIKDKICFVFLTFFSTTGTCDREKDAEADFLVFVETTFHRFRRRRLRRRRFCGDAQRRHTGGLRCELQPELGPGREASQLQ